MGLFSKKALGCNLSDQCLDTPNNALSLLIMALGSKITNNNAQGSICCSGDQTHVSHVQRKQIPNIQSLWLLINDSFPFSFLSFWKSYNVDVSPKIIPMVSQIFFIFFLILLFLLFLTDNSRQAHSASSVLLLIPYIYFFSSPTEPFSFSYNLSFTVGDFYSCLSQFSQYLYHCQLKIISKNLESSYLLSFLFLDLCLIKGFLNLWHCLFLPKKHYRQTQV